MNVQPTTSPQSAPEYTFYRSVAAADTLTGIIDKRLGMNMKGCKRAHIQIVPTPASGANPTANVLWWSEGAGAFIQEQTAITKTGIGANLPYEFTVECRDRIMFVGLNPMASGTAKIYIAGADVDHKD
jgi:hypothetical protein